MVGKRSLQASAREIARVWQSGDEPLALKVLQTYLEYEVWLFNLFCAHLADIDTKPPQPVTMEHVVEQLQGLQLAFAQSEELFKSGNLAYAERQLRDLLEKLFDSVSDWPCKVLGFTLGGLNMMLDCDDPKPDLETYLTSAARLAAEQTGQAASVQAEVRKAYSCFLCDTARRLHFKLLADLRLT